MREASDSRLLRLLNGQRIVDAMFEAAPSGISRAAIARGTGLSKPTVSALVGDLEASGLVRLAADAPAHSGVGRPAVNYEVVPEAGYVLAADIGATKITVGLADLLGSVVAERELETGPDAETALARLATAAREMMTDVGANAGAACVSVPGVYRPDRDRVEQALNLPGFDQLPVKARLGDLFGVDVQVDNDVNLAALGEADSFADDYEVSDFVVISVGTGIGMGLIVDGELYRGGTGAAGELGSLILSHALSPGGSCVTLEDLASAPALTKLFNQAVEAGHKTALHKSVEVSELFAAAAAGDAAATHVLHTAATAMATAVSHVCFIADPQRVILSGSVGANRVFVQAVKAEVERLLPHPVEIVASTLARRATFLGAISRALGALHETLVTQNLGER